MRTMPSTPSIDPAFAAVGGPSRGAQYWSASSNAANPFFAWYANFFNGVVSSTNKTFEFFFVRAVRAGSCSPWFFGSLGNRNFKPRFPHHRY